MRPGGAPVPSSWRRLSALAWTFLLAAVALSTSCSGEPPPAGTSRQGAGGSPPADLASRYPGDVGIESNPDVLFVEGFEEESLEALARRWTDLRNESGFSFAADVPPGSPGSRSLAISWRGGQTTGGHLYKELRPGLDDTLYVRYYIKYPAQGRYRHTGVWMGGFNPPSSWPKPEAGERPVGDDRFIAAAEQNERTAGFEHYDYWMDMRRAVDGRYWGNFLLNDPRVKAVPERWTCVEQMVKLNHPVTSSNGEHAIWLDGVEISHLGPGFPRGSWKGGVFTQEATGEPFEGFRWRSDERLDLNWIWLQNYSPDDPAGFSGAVAFDHVVVATSRIGCLGRPR